MCSDFFPALLLSVRLQASSTEIRVLLANNSHQSWYANVWVEWLLETRGRHVGLRQSSDIGNTWSLTRSGCLSISSSLRSKTFTDQKKYFNIGLKTVYLEVFQAIFKFPPIVEKKGRILW